MKKFLLSIKYIKYQIMKRIFILFASSLLCLSTIAQISHQFVEEGKVWNMLYHNVEAFDIFPDYKYSYLIKGDTLISDMNCKKLYTFNENNDSITVYKLALYEIEGKVYFIPSGSKESCLLYDFRIPEGFTSITSDPIHPEWKIEMRNNKNGVTEINGISRHCLYVNRVDASFEDYSSGWWIEGIGSEFGPLNTWGFEASGNNRFFVNCEVNGQEIFKFSNFVSKMGHVEYFPEGTRWTEIRLDTLKYDSWYSKVGDEWVANFETIEYYVQGEYTDKDIVYNKVYTNGPEWADSLTLFVSKGDYYGNSSHIMVTIPPREDGYIIWPGDVYQFDWSIGKELSYWDLIGANATCSPPCGMYDYGVIKEIKEGDFGGVRPLKYVDLDGETPINTEKPWINSSYGGRIIQGIGITEWNDGECLFGPPNPYIALSEFDTYYRNKYPVRHYRSMLVHFERDGEVLYDVWPEKEAVTEDPVTFTAGQMATVILPTEPDAGKGKYYRLDRVEAGQIVFEQEQQPRAHVPYIIVPFEDFSIDPGQLELEGLKPDTVSVGSISFIGTYVRTELPALTGGDGEWRPFPPSLGGDGGGFYRIIDTTPDCSPLPAEGQGERLAFVGTLRAYLTWDDPYGPGATKGPEEELKIVLHDRGTGSLSPAPSPEGEGRKDAAIYDLSGKMVNGKWLNGKSPKGIYIKDRKKWVTK